MAKKSYKMYLRIASEQILIKRGKCLHSHEWKNEITLYFRCSDCGHFCPFRNPEHVKLVGEFGHGQETPVEMVGHICALPKTEVPLVVA